MKPLAIQATRTIIPRTSCVHGNNSLGEYGGCSSAHLLARIGCVCSLAAGFLAGATAPSAGQQCPPNPLRLELLTVVNTCLGEKKPPVGSCMYVKKENNKPVYVILKDNNPKKTNAYLILPPTPVTGIEKKDIVREAPVVDFWKYGWEEGEYYFKQPPDGFIGLAINSCAGRDQDQLHIHISCVKSGVRSALKNTTYANDNWTKNPIKLENHDYYALTISSLDNSPFKILFDKSAASDHPGAQSLALIGAVGHNKYTLLNDYSQTGSKAEAEELLDENCTH